MAKKVSVIIPNYNGRSLLEKNIPSVLDNCPDCEIIIVDDASTDDSLKYLETVKGIKLIRQEKNRGFAATVNNGVRHAGGELVLLLNSDVSPTPGFLKPLTDAFINNNKLFAVACADTSHDNSKKIIKGRGGGAVSKGFFLHFALPPESGQTLWVSGGSGMFDRKKYLTLGGFDTVFAPFYWEDIDLSFRARKAGFTCLFEPKSKVDHYHELGAIKKSRIESYIKAISYKNQFLFFWKNISDPFYCIAHLLYLPYHIAVALIRADWPFFVGFAKATLQIPTLILNYRQEISEAEINDREILKNFEKQ